MNIEQAASLCGMSVADMEQRVTKATTKAQNAIGRLLNVRLDKKTTVEGTVKSVKYSHHNYNGLRTLTIVWEVVMVCGAKQYERTVKVTKLPSR